VRIKEASIWVELAVLSPFMVAGLGVCIAVFGKAFGRFPFQPDEWKTFHWPTIPRMLSKIYVVEKKSAALNSGQPTRRRIKGRRFI